MKLNNDSKPYSKHTYNTFAESNFNAIASKNDTLFTWNKI